MAGNFSAIKRRYIRRRLKRLEVPVKCWYYGIGSALAFLAGVPGGGLQHLKSLKQLEAHGMAEFFHSPATGQKPVLTTYLTTVKNFISGISAVGSAGGLGA